MKKFALAATTALVAASGAQAGGIDRSGQFLGALFEEGGETGGYVAFSAGAVNPMVGYSQGSDPAQSYPVLGLAVKQQMSDQLSFAVIVDEPFGADVGYVDGAFAGGFANINSRAITGLARYKFNENFSAHGGLRLQQMSGQIASAGLLVAESGLDVGYVAGVAYERPDIAMRVSLTYNSEIDNKFEGTENVLNETNFTVTTPASWNLEFQTGVAADTLLFGSVRYVEWEGFNLTTPGVGEYVSFSDDSYTYSLGLGRRINDNWSAAVTLGFEESNADGLTTTALAPTSGSKSIGLGATYTQGNAKISMGVTYAELGDQEYAVEAGGNKIPTGITFTDNKAIAAGIRVGFNF